MTIPLTGPSFPPISRQKPRQLVVFLHGLGADGNDLIGLAGEFARALPDAEFLSPHAPFPCDMAPMGRQWFSLQDRSPSALLHGLTMARPILDGFLDHALAARELKDSDLVLVGFSQGSMMALHTGLRRKAAMAGILAYSGMLAVPDHLPDELTAKPPVLLIHGEQDPVLSFEFMGLAKTTLELLGVPIKAIARPHLGHSIDEEGLRAGIDFVAGRFAKLQA